MLKLSIVTPTYNRSSLLQRCYDSLIAQTCFDFEWIVVDDGSEDDTAETVSAFSRELFPIIYVKKENGGKHTALNASHPYINGGIVLILDSDDWLVNNAVEQVIHAWEKFYHNTEIGIVTFLKGKSIEEPNCKAKDCDEYKPVDVMRYKRICISSGDCCEVIRSDLFKKYPFPVFDNEKFVAEGVLWDRVGFEHKCVYINNVIYICEYLEGGLTDLGRRMRLHNPRGGMCMSNLGMNKRNYLKTRVKNGILFTCYARFHGYTPMEMSKYCDNKALMWCCLPFGWMLRILWKKYD